MKVLRFQAGYMAPPFFDSDPETMGHIDVISLNLSKNLSSLIIKWDSEYQNTFNEDYPPDSKFPTPDLEKLHNARGVELTLLIQKELGNNFLINFYPVT